MVFALEIVLEECLESPQNFSRSRFVTLNPHSINEIRQIGHKTHVNSHGTTLCSCILWEIG